MVGKGLSVAVIGAGTISASHIEAHRRVGHRVELVVDVDAHRARTVAKQWEVERWGMDWGAAVEDAGIGVVDICTPPQAHQEIAVAALEGGKHVICEKPLAPNLAACDAIVRAAQRARSQLLVVHQFRALPLYRRMKWLVDSGALGRVYFARVQRYDPPPEHLVAERAWGRWDLAGGGVLMTKAIHQLDMLLGLLGPVRRVHAMMGTALCPIESEDHLTGNIEFETGALASVAVVGQRYGAYGQHFDLFGDRASVGLPWHICMREGWRNEALLAKLRAAVPDPEEEPQSGWKRLLRRVGWKLGRNWFAPAPGNMHAPLFSEFTQSLSRGAPPPVGWKEGRAAVEVCTALYESAITGRPVTVPLDPKSRFYHGVTQRDYATATA